MTRSERAAQQEARLRTQMDVLTKAMARMQAIQREEERKERDRRRYLVGTLFEEAGLMAWSDADLSAVCQALIPLLDTPNPGAVLDGLLRESVTDAGASWKLPQAPSASSSPGRVTSLEVSNSGSSE
jgi:hypothetical protein